MRWGFVVTVSLESLRSQQKRLLLNCSSEPILSLVEINSLKLVLKGAHLTLCISLPFSSTRHSFHSMSPPKASHPKDWCLDVNPSHFQSLSRKALYLQTDIYFVRTLSFAKTWGEYVIEQMSSVYWWKISNYDNFLIKNWIDKNL